MKIGLIDVDGHNWPSLPLMKISAYHKALGDDVETWFPMNHYDKVYMSKVFTFTPDVDSVIYADEIERGGTGYFYPDGGPPLPEEIEHIYPDYGLYADATKGKAFGFLTRGCPRNCGFCIVSKKEGRASHQVADLLNKVDLIAFGDVRGTNEKKAVYEIEFGENSTTTGTIKDGGLSVKFCIVDDLPALTESKTAASTYCMAYGKPLAYQLDLFGPYTVEVSRDYKFAEGLLAVMGEAMIGGNIISENGFIRIKKKAAG